ncbi:hypothetical protein CPT76_34880 [Paenibacillus sp. AR247]|nr:hypothetical protein CPT76_34880 [Paenibacillus sp. AR247]
MQSEEPGALLRRAFFCSRDVACLNTGKWSCTLGQGKLTIDMKRVIMEYMFCRKTSMNVNYRRHPVFDGSFSCDMNRFSFAENESI